MGFMRKYVASTKINLPQIGCIENNACVSFLGIIEKIAYTKQFSHELFVANPYFVVIYTKFI